MAPSAAIGSTIAGFRLERLLGQGGMGVVYLALEKELERPVALKLLARQLSEDASFRERFLREAKLAASLDHSCVVPVYRAGEADGLLYLSMRYVEGEDLGSLIAREALPLERTLALVSSLSSALDSAHARGLVHRDVKPANVLIDAEGHPYLCDFGIARSQAGSQLTKTGALTGTFAYLAPEVIEGEAASAASDLYALACLAFECLAGHPPFQAEHEAALIYQQLRDAPPSLRATPELNSVFEIALAKDPQERYASCQAFADALRAPPATTSTAEPTVSLPAPATSFLGRERELAEASGLLATSRLLTVTGPGGTGKTRFSVELAQRTSEQHLADYENGVYFCPLASLRDPSLVPSAIAQTLSVPEDPGRGVLETLRSYLRSRRILLVLDNLEHLLPCAPELSALVASCPQVTVLCTSRERLRVQLETEYELPALEDEEGVSLFCDRSGLEPSETTQELCSRLEGLPLAIELAAARMRLLTVEQLLERLSQRLDLFKADRDADPRQQTLRATIQWSYELLSSDEQTLLARLSVFAGGCTLEAAEQVCQAALNDLESLLDKSLVRRAGERYWMLETIGEFAAERLHELGEAEATGDRHTAWVLSFLRGAAPRWGGPAQQESLTQVHAENANVRVAFARTIPVRKADEALELVGLVGRSWLEFGRFTELEAATRAALGLGEGDKVFHGLALISLGFASPDLARECYAKAASLLHEAELAREAAYANMCLGVAEGDAGFLDRGLELLEGALAEFERFEDAYCIDITTNNIGYVRGLRWPLDRAEAEQLAASARHAAARARAVGDIGDEVAALDNLAHALIDAGDLDEAWSVAIGATAQITDREVGRYSVATLVVALARCAELRGECEQAMILAGAFRSLIRTGQRVATTRIAALEAVEATCRDRLDLDDADRATERGGAMDIDSLLEYISTIEPSHRT